MNRKQSAGFLFYMEMCKFEKQRSLFYKGQQAILRFTQRVM